MADNGFHESRILIIAVMFLIDQLSIGQKIDQFLKYQTWVQAKFQFIAKDTILVRNARTVAVKVQSAPCHQPVCVFVF